MMTIEVIKNKRIIGSKKGIGTIFILGLLLLATCTIAVKANPTTVDLGSAASFSVLAGSAITNTGATTIYGDAGLSPTTGAAITGFPPGAVTGTIYAVDAFGPAGSINNPGLLTTAKSDLTDAYLDAVGRTPVTVATELGATTLTPGVYKSADGTFEITGTLILSGGGDSNAVFIFQTASTLKTAASGSFVILTNGARASNVFWQVGSSATIDTSSNFVGNILAFTSITVNTGAKVDGRVLALNGAVTLQGNTIGVEDISLAPASSTNPTGEPHTVTATVTGTGNPMVGKIVAFKVVSGPNVGQTSTVMTNSNGQASFTYTSGAAGTDIIEASFVNSQGATVTSNQVTKTWSPAMVVPESALGALTAIGACFAAFGILTMKRARNQKR
jgi:hypothetical protein